jgi:elongation factor Ts
MGVCDMAKDLRARTGAGIMDCRSALQACGGDPAKAESLIRESRSARFVAAPSCGVGVVHSYIHTGGRIGALVEVVCGTDFAARTEEFKAFAHDLAMHVAAMSPTWISPEDAPWDGQKDGEADTARYLLLQPSVRDPSRSIGDQLAELSDRIGEPCAIRRFVRWEAGEEIALEEPAQPLDKPRGLLAALAAVILLAIAATFGLMLCQ